MAGATHRGKSAAAAANLRPAITWGWLGAFVAGVLVAALVFPRAQSQAQAIAGDEAPVLAADMALGEAMRAGDKTAARRLLALQFNFVDADGKSRARRDFLADLKGFAASPASDAKVRLYGLLAMVTGHRSTARNDEVFFLDIWAKQKGTWRALLTQEVVPAGFGRCSRRREGSCAGHGSSRSRNAGTPARQSPIACALRPSRTSSSPFRRLRRPSSLTMRPNGESVSRDEFVRYATGQSPVPKSDRIAAIERQKDANAAVTVAEIQTMRLAVYGDGAVMTALQAMPDNSRPPYRAARIWARRNGQWLMAISVHTDVK